MSPKVIALPARHARISTGREVAFIRRYEVVEHVQPGDRRVETRLSYPVLCEIFIAKVLFCAEFALGVIVSHDVPSPQGFIKIHFLCPFSKLIPGSNPHRECIIESPNLG